MIASIRNDVRLDVKDHDEGDGEVSQEKGSNSDDGDDDGTIVFGQSVSADPSRAPHATHDYRVEGNCDQQWKSGYQTGFRAARSQNFMWCHRTNAAGTPKYTEKKKELVYLKGTLLTGLGYCTSQRTTPGTLTTTKTMTTTPVRNIGD